MIKTKSLKEKADTLLENPLPNVLLLIGEKRETDPFLDLLLSHLFKGKKNHPDVTHIYPESKNGKHTVEGVHRFIDGRALPPFEGTHKAFIFYEADRMLPVHANALLKSLEEPLEDTFVFLLSSKLKELLPTIRSRGCEILLSSKEEEPLLKEEVLNLFEPFFAQDYALFFTRTGELEEGLKKGEESLYTLVFSLFHSLFLLYRDLHALKEGGKSLYYEKEKLMQWRGISLPSLELVHEEAQRALLAFERNVRLKYIIENFFLKLEQSQCF